VSQTSLPPVVAVDLDAAAAAAAAAPRSCSAARSEVAHVHAASGAVRRPAEPVEHVREVAAMAAALAPRVEATDRLQAQGAQKRFGAAAPGAPRRNQRLRQRWIRRRSSSRGRRRRQPWYSHGGRSPARWSVGCCTRLAAAGCRCRSCRSSIRVGIPSAACL
jgi:hypothetical protein